jgi:hypothetical protein
MSLYPIRTVSEMSRRHFLKNSLKSTIKIDLTKYVKIYAMYNMEIMVDASTLICIILNEPEKQQICYMRRCLCVLQSGYEKSLKIVMQI